MASSSGGPNWKSIHLISTPSGWNASSMVWRCRTAYNCTEACPRGIQITKAIAEVKNAILSRSM